MKVAVCTAIAILALGALSMPAHADGMRCGSQLVRDGDGRDKVLKLCGEPVEVENRSILRRPSYRRGNRIVYFGEAQVEVPIEIWTYNFGPNQLMRRVRFVDGVVEEIDTLGYGYHRSR
jgi:hypothetical protein